MPVDSIEVVHHHGWPETEAEVISCTYVPGRGARGGGELAHYVVGFAYKVNGTIYRDNTPSLVEVQPHDKFSIRYNPDHPDQNHSLFSVCDRPWFKDYMYLVGALILGLALYDLVRTHLLHR